MPNKNQYTSAQFKRQFAAQGKRISKRTEKQEQVALCNWLKVKHPIAFFNSDLAGVNLSKVQRAEYSARSCPGYPDLIIHNPVPPFSGLAIELKRTGEKVRKKNGELRQNEHLAQQHAVLKRLRGFGWCATFAVGLQDAQRIINLYFAGDLTGLQSVCFPALIH